MKTTKESFLDLTTNTPYNRPHSSSTVSFRHDLCGLHDMVIVDYENYIPVFQRENNKWSKKMQIAYVENILKGMRKEICLYTLDKSIHSDRKFILDGLQRITALNLFINDKIKVFKKFSYSEIKKDIGHLVFQDFRLYQFENEIEAVRFYIEINENITHSKEDIRKAKEYLKKLEEKISLFL